MKKKIFVVAVALLLGANLYAQRKSTAQEEKRLFEEAISRTVEPEIRMFIQPTIADVEIIATERQQYGPHPIGKRTDRRRAEQRKSSSTLSSNRTRKCGCYCWNPF